MFYSAFFLTLKLINLKYRFCCKEKYLNISCKCSTSLSYLDRFFQNREFENNKVEVTEQVQEYKIGM